jgi:hypothetical protein
MKLGRVALVSAITAAVTFLALYMFAPPLDIATILFISMGVAASVGAIMEIDRGESIGTVVGFSTVLLMLFLVAPYLPERAAIVFNMSSMQIAIEQVTLPLILLGIIGVMAIVKSVGGSVVRMSMWLLILVLTLAWFAYEEIIARILISALIAVIVFTPFEQGRVTRALFAAVPVAAYDKAIVIDLAEVNVYIAYVLPLVAFIALDPLNKVPRQWRQLASVVVLLMVFIHMLSLVIGTII